MTILIVKLEKEEQNQIRNNNKKPKPPRKTAGSDRYSLRNTLLKSLKSFKSLTSFLTVSVQGQEKGGNKSLLPTSNTSLSSLTFPLRQT